MTKSPFTTPAGLIDCWDAGYEWASRVPATWTWDYAFVEASKRDTRIPSLREEGSKEGDKGFNEITREFRAGFLAARASDS